MYSAMPERGFRAAPRAVLASCCSLGHQEGINEKDRVAMIGNDRQSRCDCLGAIICPRSSAERPERKLYPRCNRPKVSDELPRWSTSLAWIVAVSNACQLTRPLKS